MPSARTASVGPFHLPQNSPFKISFKNGPVANERQANLGKPRAAARHSEGETSMVRQAIGRTGKHVVPKTYVVPADEHEAAMEFSAVILPFSRGELARAGHRGKDAAKRWKAGQVLPSAWAMMHLARNIPEVRAWMAAKMGISAPPEFLSPQAMTTAMAAMYQVAHQTGPDGDAVRAFLSKIAKGPE